MGNANSGYDIPAMFGNRPEPDVIPGAPRGVQPRFFRPDVPLRAPGEPPQRLYSNDRERVCAYVDNQLQTIRYWEVETASVKYLKQACNFLGIPTDRFSEKREYIEAVQVRRNKECSICMEMFSVDEPVKVTHCGHLYHADCLRNSVVTQIARPFFGFTPKCAMCRAPIDRVNEHAGKVKRKNEATEEARKSRKV